MTSLEPALRHGLGRHVRRLRQAQGLTLAALAAEVGVSASALSQVERGVNEPSLGTLWRLGQALHASLFDFFAAQEADDVDVTRAAERTQVSFERFSYDVMARSAQRGIDLFSLRLEPGEGPVREPIGHAGEEAGVVLEGTMEVQVGGQVHRLETGDAIWFRSSQPHTFSAMGEAPCVSLWADTIPDHEGPVSPSAMFGVHVASADAPVKRGRRPAAGREPLEVARGLEIDPAELRATVERLAAIGSSPLGFRATGTPEDREAAAWIAGQMRAIGLADVALEEVRVDGWRFTGASVRLDDGAALEGAALGGTPATAPGGVRGRLVDAGDARRRGLDRLDLRDAVVLVDWVKRPGGLSDVGLELGLRGAAGVLVAPGPDGPFHQADGALGAFNGSWHGAAPPMATIRARDAAGLRGRLANGAVDVVLEVGAEVTPGARGRNAVGMLEGDEGGPIIVGAHHDGWFHAAFDNATGVAALLAVARGLTAAGHRPRHSVCFTSRTAEEYGRLDAEFDWCVGAWEQVRTTHPEWGAQAPFHLCLEASAHPGLRLALEAPPELERWARHLGRVGDAEGWLTSGWRTSPPVTGTEQWPLLVSGIPGLAAYTWETDWARGTYHTQFDTPDTVDFEHLARLTRFYAYILLEADRDPDAILDHRPRARELARRAGDLGPAGAGLAAAAQEHGRRRGRPSFTRVGRELLGVRADGSTGHRHDQAAADVTALEAASAALEAGDRRAAIRGLAKVGDNKLARDLSPEALAVRRARIDREAADRACWAGHSHLTVSPDLGAELASLRGERGARPLGPWVAESVATHLRSSRDELDRRLASMTQALTAPAPPDHHRSTT